MAESFLRKVTSSYFAIVMVSLALALFFSEYFTIFSKFGTVILGAIFFLSALKIDLKNIAKELHSIPTILVVNLFMLIIFPAIIFYATLSIYPTLAVAFLIIATMPSGMTSPLLAEIAGGRQSLALVLAVSTSLLAPITVPFMIKFLAGTSVTVSFFDMFFFLAKVIFVPFVLAQLLKYFSQKKIDTVSHFFKPVSVILLGLLITVVVSKQAIPIIDGLASGQSWIYLAYLFGLFIIFHIVGYIVVFWKDHQDRVTTTVCLTYMNFTLAIGLADEFFNEPHIVVPIVLSVLPWAILLSPFKWSMSKTYNKKATTVRSHELI